MNTSASGLVDTLRASRLLTDEQLEALKAAGDDLPRVIATLNQARWLTPWQLRVVESGASGPFQLGDYLLLDRLEQGPLAGNFVARHLPTSHPVLLQFVAGHDGGAAELWSGVEAAVRRLADVRHPHVLEVFSAVELPEFAFAVTELPAGKALGELLPGGKKTKAAQASLITAQVARGLKACHAAGVVHGRLNMDSVWLASRNLARIWLSPVPETEPEIAWLSPEQRRGASATTATDAWQLGALFYRLVCGQSLPVGSDDAANGSAAIQRQLAQEKVPVELQQLVARLLHPEPVERPADLDAVSGVFAHAGGDSGEAAETTPSASHLQLRRMAERDRETGGHAVLVGRAAKAVADLIPPGSPAGMAAPGLQAGSAARRRRNAGWWPWAALAAMLGMIGVGMMIWRPDEPGPGTSTNRTNDPAATNLGGSVAEGNRALAEDQETGSPPANNTNGVTAGNANSWQTVVPDDGSMLWESPGDGTMLNARGLPPAPRMVFAVRCRELAVHPEFQRLLAQPGSSMARLAAELESVTGFRLEEVAHLVVGVYPSADPARYQLFLVARLSEAVDRDNLQATLALQPVEETPSEPAAAEPPAEDPGRVQQFARGQSRVVFQSSEGVVVGKVDTVLAGSAELMAAALENGANVIADGTFARLAAVTDNGRLVTALVVPAALFNDAGQALVSGTWAPVLGRLAGVADESLRTALVAVDADQGCYLELVLDHSVDLRPEAALEKLRADLKSLRAGAIEGLASTAGHPWWERVRLQLAGMVHQLARELRTGIEDDLVIANCWLPEPAVHNLLGGAELALGGLRDAAGGTGVVSAQPAPTGPQSVNDLLRLPRSLEVTTNPDLGVLLQGIEDEINNEHGALGFRFRIRIEGPDLLKQGITQNQRPGNFSIADKPLADILTEIMFRANPNKAAAGPNDPLCELVWLITPDPEQPGQSMVLVTTRTASEEKMLELPPAFRLE